MHNKSKKIIRLFLMVLFICFIIMPVVNSNEILGIDISVSQNPIPCSGATTVTATIKRAPLKRGELPLGGIVKLWDYDSGLRDGDDIIDQEHVVLWFEETTVTFTLRCDSKDGGCDLYGPSGESGESGTNIFVSFYDSESAKIYVKCVQVEVDGEIGISGLQDVTIGDETSVIISADQPIENVTNAQFGVTYDSSVFEISGIQLINPALQVKQAEGLFSYDINTPGYISYNLSENIVPMTLHGPLMEIFLIAKDNSSTIWDTTYLRCTEDSIFYNELSEKINVCLGGNHSIFVAPDDTTEPSIDPNLISFSQGKIIGSIGSISDDFNNFENYLTVLLYNESDVLVAQDFVNVDGSFQLDGYFWLDNEKPSSLRVINGVDLSASFIFIPSSTSIPFVLTSYQTTIQNNSAAPGVIIQLEFEILGKSDSTEIYDFIVTDVKGWNIEQPNFEIVLEPMENKTIKVNVTVPSTAENGTINPITLTMTSRNHPENTASDTVVLSSYGTYEQPKPREKETPGFEIILVIIALLFVAIFLKKRK